MNPKVYIIFTAARHVISRLIRRVTRGDVSHAMALFHSADLGGWYIFQAEAKGFLMRPVSSVRAEEWKSAFEVIAHPDSKRSFLRHLAIREHAGYDYLGVATWAFAAWGNRLVGRERWQPRSTGKGRLFCSEAIAEGLRAIPLPGFSPAPSPEGLEDECALSPYMADTSVAELCGQIAPA